MDTGHWIHLSVLSLLGVSTDLFNTIIRTLVKFLISQLETKLKLSLGKVQV